MLPWYDLLESAAELQRKGFLPINQKQVGGRGLHKRVKAQFFRRGSIQGPHTVWDDLPPVP